MAHGATVIRIGRCKLYRSENRAHGAPVLQVTCDGYVRSAPKLRYDWEPFFVGHYGQERTVYSYRRA